MPTKPPVSTAPTSGSSLPLPSPAPFAHAASWVQDFARMPAGVPDARIWNYELNPEVPGWNDEKQAYTNRPDNVRVEAGKGLVIEARQENYEYPNDAQKRQFGYTSGRIDTRNSFSFEYGKVEAVMKLPRGAGSWPAFWALSANQLHTSKLNPTDADWEQPRFYAKDGELDIMEHYGHLPGIIEGTAHSYLDAHEGNRTIADYADTFHAYGVEVTPSGINWTIDGNVFYKLPKVSDNPDAWPFGSGNKMYLILNLAMGGSGGGAIDNSKGSWRMEVQQVRYFPYIGP